MFNIQNTPFEISIQLRETSALYSIFIPDICICMESIVSTIIENLIRWKLNYLSRRFVSNSIRILCIVHRSLVSRSEREVEERETPSTRSRVFFFFISVQSSSALFPRDNENGGALHILYTDGEGGKRVREVFAFNQPLLILKSLWNVSAFDFFPSAPPYF